MWPEHKQEIVNLGAYDDHFAILRMKCEIQQLLSYAILSRYITRCTCINFA